MGGCSLFCRRARRRFCVFRCDPAVASATDDQTPARAPRAGARAPSPNSPLQYCTDPRPSRGTGAHSRTLVTAAAHGGGSRNTSASAAAMSPTTLLRTINALTLCTRDMARSCEFYSSVGLKPTLGGPDAAFTTFSATRPVTAANNALHINLILAPSYVAPPPLPGAPGGWGRAVFFVDDVDALHLKLGQAGIMADEPRDAPWGERFFHVLDPDGHELSFATPDYSHPRWSQRTDALDDALDELRDEQSKFE